MDRPLGGLRDALPVACRAVEHELHRVASPGLALHCAPELASFASAHASVTMRAALSGGPVTFGILRAILEPASPAVLAAALDWLARKPGAWRDAEQAWEAARQYDGEIPGVPAETWDELRVGVLRRVLDTFSRDDEPAAEAACEDEALLWTDQGWSVIEQDAPEWSTRARFLRSYALRANQTAARFAASLRP
jgi:hypothetical protein